MGSRHFGPTFSVKNLTFMGNFIVIAFFGCKSEDCRFTRFCAKEEVANIFILGILLAVVFEMNASEGVPVEYDIIIREEENC